MAEDLTGDAKAGYKNSSGKQVVYPQYEAETDDEYKSVVDATKKGKPLDADKSKLIQGNIDRRAKNARSTAQNKALRAKYKTIKASRKTAP